MSAKILLGKIACSVCGALTDLHHHEFYEGVPERPARRWSYVAALYHHPVTRAPFCSASCALKARDAA